MEADVTVVMPVCNAMPHLIESVSSVLHQTLSDLRFVIIDDGSADGSGEWLDRLRDDRVTVVHQRNQGQGFAANCGISMCHTKYIARMDADDVMDTDRLARQREAMEANPKLVVLGTGVRFLVGDRTCKAPPPLLRHEDIRRALLRGRSSLTHPSLMLRAEAVKAMGGYRLAGSGEDLDFCLRMCDVGLAANLPDVLLGYRLHMGSASVTRLADMRRGYAYAIECAKRRSIGLSEPEMGAFSVQWRQRGWWPRTMDRLEDAGTVRYRRAVIDLALGRGVRGCWGLALAAACRPSAVAYRLLGRLA